MRPRSEERIQFLADVLITAIESGMAGNWMNVREYSHPDDNPAGTYAVIREARWAAGTTEDPDAAPREWRVDLDLIARGLSVIRRAELREVDGGDRVLHNVETGQRLHMSEVARKNIMLADRTNLDDGDIDVLDALAILECACYGAVTYA